MKLLTAALVFALVGLMAFAGQSKAEKEYPKVVMETTEGKMVIELWDDKAPLTVQNFLWYVDNGFYDGLTFHRVIKNFVIQGGGFTPDMKKKAGNPPIENEATNGLKNEKYTLSMARTNAVNSATSQFFINCQDNPALDHRNTTARGFGYAVFGKVVDGTDTVEAIRMVPTTNKNGMADVPKTPVVIKKAYRMGEEKKKMEKAEG